MGKLITSLTKPFLWFVSLFLQILVRRRRDLAYAEHSQASKMELLPKIVIGWKPLTIFAKSSVLDVWLGSECTG